MDDITNYVDILVLTLKKKKEVLENIEVIALEQNELLLNYENEEDNIEVDDVVEQLDRKDKLIKKLNELDDGFENIYQRAHEDVINNKELYKEQVQQMQKYIKDIAELTIKLQVYEEKNRPMFVRMFEQKKKQIKAFKVNNRTAARYYRNMSNTHQDGQSYFLDKKK